MMTPFLLGVLGTDLKHWCAPLIESGISLIAIIIAWYMQILIAAFYAAVRGGRLFAQGFFGILVEQSHKGVTLCPGIVDKDFDPNSSVLDEIVGYIIAAQGFMFQITNGFALTFPWNILLLPLNIVEWFIRWQLTGGSAIG